MQLTDFYIRHGLLADKSMSILLGRPIALRDEDCTVHFPKELDDDWYLSPSLVAVK
jgi:hypothetical protein